MTLNIIQVLIGLTLFSRSRKNTNPEDASYLKLMRTMGLIFVIVACYRSIFVSSYLKQLAWFDTVFNSSLLIRSFAIFAELSFAGLIAKSLLRMNQEVPDLINPNNKVNTFLHTKTPIIFFFCIFIANILATTATITRIDLCFALEETFWGIGFVAIMPTLFLRMNKFSSYRNSPMWDRLKQFRIALILITVFSIGYGIFQLGFNLPIMLWPGAIAQLQMDIPEPAFRFGFQAVLDAFLIVNETKDLNAWGGIGFLVWHSGYFSVCVWIVLYLMTGPRLLSLAAE